MVVGCACFLLFAVLPCCLANGSFCRASARPLPGRGQKDIVSQGNGLSALLSTGLPPHINAKASSKLIYANKPRHDETLRLHQ